MLTYLSRVASAKWDSLAHMTKMNKENETKNPAAVKNSGVARKIKTSYMVIANRLMVCLVIAAGVLYLGGTNDLAINRFVVYKHKTKLSSLKEENRNLETKVMALSSYNAINKKVASLKMVKVDKVDYITLNQVVAKR